MKNQIKQSQQRAVCGKIIKVRLMDGKVTLLKSSQEAKDEKFVPLLNCNRFD
jgi:hypothetical protein